MAGRRSVADVRHTTDIRTLVPDDAGEFADEFYDILSRIETGYWPVIDVGPGWYKLVAKLHTDINAIYPNYRVRCIKTEAGALKFDVSLKDCDSPTLREILALINVTVGRSRSTCDVCGVSGSLVVDGVATRTRCTRHVAQSL